MRGVVPNWLVSVELLVALTPWCVGCSNGIYVKRNTDTSGEAGGGAIEVRVFENWSDLHRGVVSNRTIRTELYRAEFRSGEPIRQGTVARWTASDLAAGRYFLRIRWSGKTATTGATSGAQDKPLVIRTGQTTVVDVVVKDARKTWVRVAIRAAVVIGVTYGLAYQAVKSWGPLRGFSLH